MFFRLDARQFLKRISACFPAGDVLRSELSSGGIVSLFRVLSMAVTPCVVCCDVNFATLRVEKTYYTLKHDADVNLTLTIYPNNVTPSHVRIEARYYDEDTGMFGPGPWCTIAEGSSISTFRAKIAGQFQVRAIVTVCGVDHISDPDGFIVRFPTYDQIVSDPDIKELMKALWDETVRLSSTPLVWRELGTYIRLDTATELYNGDQLLYGPEVRPGTDPANTPYLELPIPEDRPEFPSPCADGGDYYVADFHTHPPATHVPVPHGTPSNAASSVGPSTQDKRASYAFNLPGIVYDQLPNVMVPVPGTPITTRPPDDDVVFVQTPLDAPAGPYHTLKSVDRRPTPEYRSSEH